MRILLDTHVFLWWILASPEISRTARGLIADPSNELLWSSASSWEIAIKVAARKLALPEPPERYLPRHLSRNQVRSLAINDAHAFHAGQLPAHHRDPFDRMLVAQALVEDLVLLSSDPLLAPYGADVRW